MRAPIVARKHYVQTSLSTITAGAANPITLISAVAPGDVNTAVEVSEGSVVKAVFVEMWVRAGETGQGTSLLTLVKTSDAQTPTFTDMVALDAYKNKKNVLYHTQGLTNQETADAIPFVRGWFKIPKGKQRFGSGDTLFLVVSAQALANEICGFCTYKSYS